MYRLSARQILTVALLSALFAAGTIAVVDRLANRFQPSGAAFSEEGPRGITDPAVATDEQNNIELYRALSPGVVNVHSTSYARDFFGFVEPQEGSGSGSVIDQRRQHSDQLSRHRRRHETRRQFWRSEKLRRATGWR